MSAISDISDRYVNELAQLEPGMALALGLPTVEDSLTDYSPDGHAARAQLRSRTRAQLVAAEPEDDRDSVARRVMLERLDYAAELHDAGEWRRDLNILASPFQSIRSIFDLLPRETADDYAAIARRMSQVPQALERYRASLHEGAQRGFVPARRQVIECARQGIVWANSPGASFFDNLIPDGESLPASVLADLPSRRRLSRPRLRRNRPLARRRLPPGAPNPATSSAPNATNAPPAASSANESTCTTPTNGAGKRSGASAIKCWPPPNKSPPAKASPAQSPNSKPTTPAPSTAKTPSATGCSAPRTKRCAS